MSRPPQFPVEVKIRIVLSVLAGEMTVAEAARKNKTSETSVAKWKARAPCLVGPYTCVTLDSMSTNTTSSRCGTRPGAWPGGR